MEIHFASPNHDDIKKIYETYRIANEPDSPTAPFENLSDIEIKAITDSYPRVMQIAVYNEQKVGWITIINRNTEPEINLGFGLFPEFRGKGLMSKIIRLTAMNTAQKQIKKISAEARTENIAAVKTLERAGFIPKRIINRPLPREGKESIQYTHFVFAPSKDKKSQTA